MSLDLIMGYTGMVSFGHAAYFGLGAYGSALVLIHFGQPIPVALLAGALLAGLIAAPVGWFSTRATGIYFAMLTLAFAQLLYTVAYKWRDLTGGSDGIASPEVMFWVLSGQGLMMVITGGIGTLVGPIIGAMVFILVQEILSSYTEHWMIFPGAIFVLMVIFLPGGLVGPARRLIARA